MRRWTFDPLGNSVTNFMDMETRSIMVLDYADMRNPNGIDDLRWDTKTDIAGKLKAKDRSDVDVFCITHIRNDHF